MDHFIILFVCDLEQTCSPIKEKRNCSPTKIQQRGLNERSRICFSTQKRGVKLQVLRSGTISCTEWLNCSYSSRLVAIVVERSLCNKVQHEYVRYVNAGGETKEKVCVSS